MKSAKTASIIAAVLLVTASLALRAAATDYQFKDETGKFTAQFPASPTQERQEGSTYAGAHVHTTWEVEHEGRHFSVTYTEYATAPVKNYDKNVMGMLAATKGKLLRQSKIEVDGVDGREVYTLLPDNAVMRQRLFQVGNRFYQAVYAGPFGTESRDDVETFMGSFRILK
jgi:hypothetical protein